MSDTYNYNAGSPIGTGGILGGLGCGNGLGCNGIMDLIALVIVGGLFGGFTGGGIGFNGVGRVGGQLGADAYAATTAALISQQQTGERVAGIATGVDAVAGLVTAQGTKLETVKDAVVNGFYANQTGLCQSFNNVAQQFNAAAMQATNNQNATTALLNDMRFENAKCCCDTRSQIESKFCALDHRLSSDKCDILGAVAASEARILAQYNADKTQRLQEELAAAKAQLSQNAQTASIIGAIQANCNAPRGCNPCGNSYGYNCNPCGCNGAIQRAVDTALGERIGEVLFPTTATAA